MNCLQSRFPMRVLVLSVAAALANAAAPARAGDSDEAVRDLTQPTTSVEVGGLYVDHSSAKFGEYTGLNKEGGYAIGNLEAYGGDGPASAYRWRILGINLGLDSRYLLGEVGTQGSWRLTGVYDQIPHNAWDNYQTLWNGAGSSTLTLPAGYPAASTRLSSTGTVGGVLANWNNIQSPNATASTTGGGPGYVIPANMKPFDIGTERKRGNVFFSMFLGPGLEFKASVRHEEKDGTKLTGVNIGRFTGVSALLPEPIDSSHDQFELGISFTGQQAFFNFSYYGSLYHNNVNLWTVDNPGANNAVLNNVARLQSYPDNEMSQFNLSGGYKFTPYTRLTFSGSLAHLTQDESFIASPSGSTWVVPESSAHAKVSNSSFLARLTSNVAKGWNLSASYKYQDRDNHTPIATFLTTGGDTAGASTQYSNEPINRKENVFNLDADYSLGRGQGVKAEYEYQKIDRTSTAEESPFRAETTTEDTVRFEYRRTLDESLTGRISYSYSKRRSSDYEVGNPAPVNPPAPLPAVDPLLPGFEQFYISDRDRNKVRSTLNYQASDTVTVQGTLDYNRDHYPSQYGLSEAQSFVFGLDGGWAASQDMSFSVFYNYEDMKSTMNSLAIARGSSTATLVPHTSGPPCAAFTNVSNVLPSDYYTDSCRQWTEEQADKVHTLGVAGRVRNLMGGRLAIDGDLTYQHATTPINVTGGTYFSNGVPSSATGNVWIGAQSYPDIVSEYTQLRLAGTYLLDKQSSVRLTYIYGHMKSSDWQYDNYSNSSLGVLAVQNYIGPGITAPNYNVNAVGISYLYRFR